jgi:imidazolonepropionase-like amidohydrolase
LPRQLRSGMVALWQLAVPPTCVEAPARAVGKSIYAVERFIPGLIDAHVHLGVAENEGESVVQAIRTTLAPTLSGHLRHGVTTVRTAGGRMRQSAELRDLLESGEVIVCGSSSWARHFQLLAAIRA